MKISLTRSTILIFVIGLFAGIFLIFQLAFRDHAKNGETDNKVVVPQVPEKIDFAGEKVPLDRWEVYEAFDRELIYNYNNSGHMTYLLKLSNRFFPIIEERLKANGIPDDFKYLCVAESNLQNLVSRVGASGYWQFMRDTAPGYNLEVNENVDERYEIIKSTDAACKYLKRAYEKFGTWTAAAASFNCGMAGYNNFATYQQTKYYYDLLLPEETGKYIFRILTFKYIMSNPEDLGFINVDEKGYKPIVTRKIQVSSIADLSQWAIENKSSYKMLKILNPWLRGKSLPPRQGKTYTILLPSE